MCLHDVQEGGPLAKPDQPTPQPAEPFPWHIGVFDVHCHVAERTLSVASLPNMKARAIAVMATRSQDQSIVAAITESHGAKSVHSFDHDSTTIIAGYGRHPWFSHELYDDSALKPTYTPSEDVEAAKEGHYKAVLTPSPEDPAFWQDLPTPVPLSAFIEETRARLLADPVAIIGEIGLDKAFRLPMQWLPDAKAARDPNRTPGGRERRALSPYHIQMSHQQAILKAHLVLAGELGRAVSVHGVQVHGILYDALKDSWKGHEIKSRRSKQAKLKQQTESIDVPVAGNPFPPRICLHSFSGKAEAVKQYLNVSYPAKIFFSFSKTNNLSSEASRSKTEDAVSMVPDNRLLVESDLHTAGDQMDADLEDMYRALCGWKGWSLEDGVRIIGNNYKEFIFG